MLHNYQTLEQWTNFDVERERLKFQSKQKQRRVKVREISMPNDAAMGSV